MHTGSGHLLELILEDGRDHLRLSCPSTLLPAPGQYLLASGESTAALPVPLFYTDWAPQGFVAAAGSPVSWDPGNRVSLRGPLGRGFLLPPAARRVGLVAFDDHPARLRGLIRPAIQQDAGVVLVGGAVPHTWPDVVEVQPLSALDEIVEWADYLAIDVDRGNLHLLREQIGKRNHLAAAKAQVLIRTQISCGGMAECGVCAVTLRSDWRFACKDGPVFDWSELQDFRM